MKPNLGKLLTLASVLLVALSTLALATDEHAVEVQTTVGGNGTRILRVYEAAGDTQLTHLSLTPGVPSPFRVEVHDTALRLDGAFDVESVLNNLYPDGDATAAPYIPSGHVTASYPTLAVSSVTEQVDVTLTYLLSGSGITCDDITGLNITNTLTCTTQLITDLLFPSGLTVADVPIAGGLVENVDLSGVALEDLPINLLADQPEPGPYTNADYTGIGAADTAAPGGWQDDVTSLRYLAGRPVVGALDGELLDAIPVPDLSGVSLVPDIASLSEVLAALSAAGGDAAVLAQALGLVSNANAITTVNNLLTPVLRQLEVGDIVLTGRHTSYPRLTVAPDEEIPPGNYSGTLTVTLFD